MGWYLDGRVSAVIGTHTHVQTADERVLPAGTAVITDVGMTGARDSVIGIEKDLAIRRFLQQMPVRFACAKKEPPPLRRGGGRGRDHGPRPGDPAPGPSGDRVKGRGRRPLEQLPLKPAEETRRIYTVSEINALARDVLESSFYDVWVEGEVSNLRSPGSGHLYFTLKDPSSQIAAVLFRSQAALLRFRLEDGLKVDLPRADLPLRGPGHLPGELPVDGARREGLPAARLRAAQEAPGGGGAVRGVEKEAPARPSPEDRGDHVPVGRRAAGLPARHGPEVRQRPDHHPPGPGAGGRGGAGDRRGAAEDEPDRGLRRPRASAAGEAPWRISGPSTRRWWPGRWPTPGYRSSRRWATRSTSPSAISPPTSARPPRPRPRSWWWPARRTWNGASPPPGPGWTRPSA